MPDPLPPNKQVPPPIVAPQKKRKLFLIISVFFLVVMIAFYFVAKNQPDQITALGKTSVTLPVSPTPIPFYDMTIPYLREREYKSELGVLDMVSENTTYTSYLTSFESDGLKVNGLLTVPKNGSGKHPAIVFVHGYIPPTQYSTLERYTDYVNYLASNGFVVFKIDLRGHGTSEGEPGGGYYSSDYVIDVLNAYAALQEADFVDENKVGLWGHSMAGNIILRSMAAVPSIPAGVIWAGAGFSYEDLQKYRISDASYQPPPGDSKRLQKRQKLFDTYGRPSLESNFWKQVAATSYLGELQGAIALHHAVDDSTVDIGYSRDLNSLLSRTTVPHELFEYQFGGHNITGSSFTLAMQRTVAFFTKHLN